jgi:tetratricopeptide (TPR) repeat protein
LIFTPPSAIILLVAVFIFHAPNSMDISELDIDFLSQKLSDDPQSPLFARLADLYLMKNQAEEALRLCEAGIEIYPAYASAFVVLGQCHLALKEKAKARTAFQRAMQLSPFNQVAKTFFAEIPENAADEERTVEDEFLTPVQDSAEISQPLPQTTSAEELQAPPPESREAAGDTHQQRTAAFPSLEEYLEQKLNAKPESSAISLDEYLGVSSSSVKPDHIEAIAEQLQNVGRIVPRLEDARGDDTVPAPEVSSDESSSADSNIVTPTLAEIYASQGKYSAAIQTYEILILSKPDEREKFEQRIKELQAKLFESEGLT